ncbi:alpha/beta hydrolase [Acetobacter sacchari]|uniref:Alpha/beta hydrolase n=1 Tax=Acetobacter sacchari TaxID=2661687 RepID=A0ABS3LX31_9PROT|nr:alpha/beta hydrolase [Acetobacter sacchari]MBO1360464.1 alpha/beta hydrolase [Acetobacter sacchari]
MPHSILGAPNRRNFLGFAAASTTALELSGLIGLTGARAASLDALLPPLRYVDAGPLRVGYMEMGPENGPAVLLLHGWPYDIHAFDAVAPVLAASGFRVLVPYVRGYGATTFRSASTMRNAQQAALGKDAIDFLDALGIKRAIFAGFDWGARTADVVASLWPERCAGLVSVSGYLIGTQKGNAKPLLAAAEYQWWYQFYFATERGRLGYMENTKAFNRLIWQNASPRWQFSDATYARSAQSFDNPDHVAIVIHNYRWRLGLADGERQYDALEARLAAGPVITAPTITMEGDANGAPHPAPDTYRARFGGRYEHRLIRGGIGHNLPQEAPHAFAAAVRDVAA